MNVRLKLLALIVNQYSDTLTCKRITKKDYCYSLPLRVIKDLIEFYGSNCLARDGPTIMNLPWPHSKKKWNS